MGLLLLAGIQLFGLLLYAGSLGGPPLWDDVAYVVRQPFLMECSNLPAVFAPAHFTHVLPVSNAARPLWLASTLAARCAFGPSFTGLRLVALLWHLAAASLVAGAAWELLRRRRAAFLAGLLFVAHPVLGEAVRFVSFSAECMALSFVLLGFLLYRGAQRARGWKSAALAAATGAAYLCAMLSKESGVVLPLLLLLSDALVPVEGGWTRRGRAAACAALLLLFGGYLLFRAPRAGYAFGGRGDLLSELARGAAPLAPAAEGYAVPPPVETDPMPWQEVYARPSVRLYTMSKVGADYLRLLLWPVRLQADYAPTPVRSWTGALPAWSLGLLWLGVAWSLRRRRPALALGLFWVPAALLPVSGLVELRNLEAERYLYGAAAGFCLALAAALEAAAERAGGRRAEAAALCAGLLLAGLYGTRTVLRGRVYRGEEEFFAAIVAADPGAARARFNLASFYARRGRLGEAETQLREGLRRWPENSAANRQLARVLEERGSTY
ncbi:MAG: hypothetical protein WC969_02415 [Elusimicrobiota bacterium]